MHRPVLVTTCMGRLSHLRQSLASWLEHTPYDIVVVTFAACPDQTKAKLTGECSRVTCIELPTVWERGQAVFNKPLAINQALKCLRVALRTRVVMIDADTLVTGPLGPLVEEHGTMCVVRPAPETGELTGFLAADLYALALAGDYDEGMSGYGAEDLDMRTRLYLRSVTRLEVLGRPPLRSIAHDDELRTRHYANKDRLFTASSNLRRMLSRLNASEQSVLATREHDRDILLGAAVLG